MPPVSGNSATTRHASWTGARAVVETWTARQSAYLQLVRNAGAITDQEAAALLKCQLCSINSVRGQLNKSALHRGEPKLLIEDGHDEHTFVDPSGVLRTTRRTRWKVRT